MTKIPALFRIGAAVAALAIAPVAVRADLPLFAGVELKIRDEVAPPGGNVQVHVFVTEPKLTSGSVAVAPGLSIDKVSPGSADLPAGSGVRITGQGFKPRTKVHFNETLLAEVRYVDSAHLDVVLASPTRMHGLRIKVENRDGSRTRYYSYQRTKRQGANVDPILRDVVPLFSSQGVTAALVDIATVPTGLALQNLESSPALVDVELLAPDGQRLAATTLRLLRHISRDSHVVAAHEETRKSGWRSTAAHPIRSARDLARFLSPKGLYSNR